MKIKADKFIVIYIQAIFYLFAGVNHFIHPEFYLPLIQPYFQYIDFINLFSGMAEIALAIGILIPSIRQKISWLIIIMLIAFIPSHIYFIQLGANIADGFSTPLWVAWFRLVVIHPLLIIWAYRIRKYQN